MSLYAFSEFMSGIIILSLAITIYWRNPYDNFYKLFSSGLAVVFAAIFFEYRVSASQNIFEAALLNKFADCAWIFAAAISFHAMLAFSGSERAREKLFLFIIYLPATIFSLTFMLTNLTFKDFIDTPFGIAAVPNLLYFWLLFAAMFYVFGCIYLCVMTYLRTDNKLKKNQAFYLAVAFFIPFALGLSLSIFPFLLERKLPNTLTLACTFSAVLTGVAALRYHLFPKYPALVGETVFSFLPDILLVTDANNKINLASKSFLQLIGEEKGETLTGKSLSEVIGNQAVANFLGMNVLNGGKKIQGLTISLKEKIFCLNVAQIKDVTLDTIGMITIGRDVTERKHNETDLKKSTTVLEENLKEIDRLNREFTERELEMAKLKDEIKRLKEKASGE